MILLAENMAAFCPCPNNLIEAKLKSPGLTSLTEKILRQLSINCVVWFIDDHSYTDLQCKGTSEEKKNVRFEGERNSRGVLL